MKKRSFFFKEYLTHFILIVVAFALAGSVFYHQMASYALRAKQTELKTTVQSLVELAQLRAAFLTVVLIGHFTSFTLKSFTS